MAMDMNSSKVMMYAAVSSSGLRPATCPNSTLFTATGAIERGEILGPDSRGGRAVLHGDDLNGSGDDRLQLLVGASSPLQLLRVDDEQVDVAIADGLFAGRQRVVVVDTGPDVDSAALRSYDVRQRSRDGPGETDVLRAPTGVDQRWERDHSDHRDDHDHDRGDERPGSASFPQLALRDQPGLARAVHAATASRNSSDSVGG